MVLNMKKKTFFQFFYPKYLFYKFLLMLVKKTQVWQQFTGIDVGGTTRARCNRGMSCQLERHFSTTGMNYGMLRSSLGVDKLSFLFKQLNNGFEEKFFKKQFLEKKLFPHP